LLIRANERGSYLGSIAGALLRLLDCYGAAELQVAITEALDRNVPRPVPSASPSSGGAMSASSSRRCPRQGTGKEKSPANPGQGRLREGSLGLTRSPMRRRSLKVAPITAPVHNDLEIETAIIALGREPGGGLLGMPDVFVNTHRAAIILAAARNNAPAVYYQSPFARDGGLLSYGIDSVDSSRRAASYVDRILRGAKPAELSVQFPVKYEMVVNLKTAKALGLAVPSSILVRADEVIE
jgi:ABC transporter substrate binding protein